MPHPTSPESVFPVLVKGTISIQSPLPFDFMPLLLCMFSLVPGQMEQNQALKIICQSLHYTKSLRAHILNIPYLPQHFSVREGHVLLAFWIGNVVLNRTVFCIAGCLCLTSAHEMVVERLPTTGICDIQQYHCTFPSLFLAAQVAKQWESYLNIVG